MCSSVCDAIGDVIIYQNWDHMNFSLNQVSEIMDLPLPRGDIRGYGQALEMSHRMGDLQC